MLQLLRKIAFPFSLIYALVVFIRNRLFDMGIFKSKTYRTPTICIGNLSVGGTGKTPMIEYLVRLLEKRSIAVLSRGYKRKSKGFLFAGPNSSVEDLGDEPFQLHKKFPNITVAVDGDRQNGIQQLESTTKPDMILLDDAFQHRRVKSKFSILLTAHGNLFVDDWYLPTGDLRDSKMEAKRADLIVVTKCPADISNEEKNSITRSIDPKTHQKVLFASLTYAEKINNGAEQIGLNALRERKFALVTGIASPEPLVTHLESQGLQFDHFEFGDHHYFSADEIEKFANFETVLTTEKDYVRLEGRVENLYYLEVAHNFGDEDREVLKQAILAQI
ncbi:tetraacyldisaccharide 4'-kinase [Flagellimonas sp. S3867]|uniref:tetraacyldisaccharide 4'-kinase n=1 Tax=Flagellimonas sp. S3867 TaxID=2768063 RepID=UPI001688DA00|nr:tetraacyldisaccharide 4'-kinase [Flagellimonas sp. S3867]